jgi:pimeloyl-ACP methyl ester carboxylesterase
MVDVGDHRLHLYSRGEASGGPTVVIDAANGGWSLDWRHVQTELSTTTRVVTYDRAGYGWSERGPTPRTSWRVAGELRSALEVAGIDGPYVLVGHFFGGHMVRLLADELSEDVAGVVLVDARQEDVHRRLPPEATELPPLELFEATARLGIVRLMIAVQGADAPGLPPSLNEMEPDVRETYLAIGFEPEYFRAVRGEVEAIEESDEQVRNAGSMGDVPLTVISHDVPDVFEGLDAEDANRAEDVWQEGQRALARLSTDSSRLVAEGAGHNVQFDRPDLVLREIEEMI